MRRAEQKPKTAAIKARAESQRGKTATPAPSLRGEPDAPDRADSPSSQRTAELRDRLWALCSPVPAAAYEPPWGGIAADLAARLGATLAAPGVYPAAAAASHLGYTECIKTLVRASPAVHRVLTEIRGLALAAVPAQVDAKKDVAVEVSPGVPLVYEDIAVF